MLEDPYNSSFETGDVKVANMQANGVEDYEIDANLTYGKYKAESVIRYDDHDEFTRFRGEFIENGVLHKLSSKTATRKDDIIELEGDALYENLANGIKYSSPKIYYDKKIIKSDAPFVLTQNNDKITGVNSLYDINKQQLNANKVKAWIQRN